MIKSSKFLSEGDMTR